MTMRDWGYAEHNGPASWHQYFPLAEGDRQSPIDIQSKEAKHDPNLHPLRPAYDPKSAKIIVNSGHSFTVEFDDSEHHSALEGGPLTDSYRLRQLHLHWGSTDKHGSEHTVDGSQYAAELHVVHWNSEKYTSFVKAAVQPDGLAVIGCFLELGDHNSALQTIVDALDDITFKGDKATFKNFDPRSLLPASLDYWTYPGSLTVPPLLESVIWVVLRHPISVSSNQLSKFRSLFNTKRDSSESCCMISNFRPPQPLRDRQVRAFFS